MTATPITRLPEPVDTVLVGWTGPDATQRIALRKSAINALMPSSGFANVATLDENNVLQIIQEVRYTVMAINLAAAEGEGVIVYMGTSAQERDDYIVDNAEAWLGT